MQQQLKGKKKERNGKKTYRIISGLKRPSKRYEIVSRLESSDQIRPPIHFL
jgi:hypothetical protein